jgi:lantibiotic modifying enzyme
VAWIGLQFDTTKDKVSLMPLGIDLYDGLPGIALFLAYLGMITQERRYTELGRATLLNMRYQIEQKSFMTGIGAFDGWGGLVYSLIHLGVLWKEALLIKEPRRLRPEFQILSGQISGMTLSSVVQDVSHVCYV